MSPSTETGKQSLKSQSAWLLFAKVAGFGFAFILPLIVVRILTQEEFGTYRQTFLVVMNAVAILPVGISMSAYYYLARDKTKRPAAVLNIMVVHFAVGFIAFLILFLAPGILGKIFSNPEMARLAPLIGIAVWIWLFSVFLEHAAVANREPRIATVFIVFAQFSKTALMAGFVLWFGTVESIVWAAIIQAGIQTLILLVYLNSRFPNFWTSFDYNFFKEHIAYAVPFGVAGILWTMQVDLHYYFVSYRFGEAAYAIYAVGCFQLPLISMLSESIVSVLIPRMSELQLADDKKEMFRVTARAMQKLSFAYFPLYVFFIITAETFITTLFTDRYVASVPVFLVFLTLMPFSILISDPIVRAYEDLGRVLLKVRITTFIILVAGLFLGINYLGLTGVIAIVVAIRIIEKIFVLLLVFRKIDVRATQFRQFADIGKTAVISILAGITTLLIYRSIRGPFEGFADRFFSSNLPELSVGLSGFATGVLILGVTFAAFATVYVGASYLAGTIEEGEKNYVRALFRNNFRRSDD